MRKQNISIYSALVVGTYLLGFVGAGVFLYIAISASRKLHSRMFEKLLGAKIYFFDTNPVGKCELIGMRNNLLQEGIKGKRATPHIGSIPIIIPLKLFFAAKWREIHISNNLLSFKAITLKLCSNKTLVIL